MTGSSRILATSEFSKLRRVVFAHNPCADLRSINRDEAVFRALEQAEMFKGVFFLQLLRLQKHVPDSSQILMQTIESLHFAMRWIFESCLSTQLIELPAPSAHSTATIEGLLEKSYVYAPVDQLLDTVSAGMAQAEQLADGTIEISQPDPEICRAFFANARLTRNAGLAKASPHKFREPDPKALTNAIRTSIIVSPRSYSTNTSAFNRLLLNHEAERANFWIYDQSDTLGTYNFGHLRKFWMCLYTISLLHVTICQTYKQHILLFKTRHQWIEEISQSSGLSSSIVSAILEDLTYDSALYLKGQAQADIASQPFFPVGRTELVLSNLLVIPTNAERNIWDLVSLKRPEIFSVVESKKERRWANGTLLPYFRTLGYDAWSHIKFEDGDIDLFVVDRAADFALAIELKWLKGQHSVKDLQHTNKKLIYAIDQASRSIKWLKTCPQEVLNRTGFTGVELNNLQIEPLVVSRNSLGGPSVHSLAVPVINEFLLQLALEKPRSGSLQDLVNLARTRSYLPKFGYHFSIDSWEESYAGIRFRSQLNPKILREWDHHVDLGL